MKGPEKEGPSNAEAHFKKGYHDTEEGPEQ